LAGRRWRYFRPGRRCLQAKIVPSSVALEPGDAAVVDLILANTGAVP
jgi:hypothetical protein